MLMQRRETASHASIIASCISTLWITLTFSFSSKLHASFHSTFIVHGQMSSVLPSEDDDIEGLLDLELDPALWTFLAKYDDADTAIPMGSPHLLSLGNNDTEHKDVTDSEREKNKQPLHQRRREEIVRLREEVKDCQQCFSNRETASNLGLRRGSSNGQPRPGEN